MSHRHFIARFRESVGLGPKRCARILRFNRALRLIDSGAPLSGAGVAYDCGYNDQSHLIRDFREFSGHTPTALVGVRRDTALFEV